MIALQIYLTAAVCMSVIAFIITCGYEFKTLPVRKKLFGSIFAGLLMGAPIGLVAAIWTLL